MCLLKAEEKQEGECRTSSISSPALSQADRKEKQIVLTNSSRGVASGIPCLALLQSYLCRSVILCQDTMCDNID